MALTEHQASRNNEIKMCRPPTKETPETGEEKSK
jgi:hypothetical protein